MQISLGRVGKCLYKFGRELYPTKTRIVYCKDDYRLGEYPETKFAFLAIPLDLASQRPDMGSTLLTLFSQSAIFQKSLWNKKSMIAYAFKTK
jgi:hypothetical protein